MSLAERIASPAFTAAHPLYVVGRTSEKRSHYVHAARGWDEAASLCGQAPGALSWNSRSSMAHVCQACHAAACRMPCEVKKAPDTFYNRTSRP